MLKNHVRGVEEKHKNSTDEDGMLEGMKEPHTPKSGPESEPLEGRC